MASTPKRRKTDAPTEKYGDRIQLAALALLGFMVFVDAIPGTDPIDIRIYLAIIGIAWGAKPGVFVRK